jgi:hypothetical protein
MPYRIKDADAAGKELWHVAGKKVALSSITDQQTLKAIHEQGSENVEFEPEAAPQEAKPKAITKTQTDKLAE